MLINDFDLGEISSIEINPNNLAIFLRDSSNKTIKISYWDVTYLNPLVQVQTFTEGYLALKDVKNLKVKMVIRKKIVERSSSSTIYHNGEH